MSDHDHDIESQVRAYKAVFVALMGLTIITVAISYLDLFTPAAITLALTVALIKGTLVAGIFMHLFDEKKVIYAVMSLTVAFFFLLLVLPIVTSSDHIGELQQPNGVTLEHHSDEAEDTHEADEGGDHEGGH